MKKEKKSTSKPNADKTAFEFDKTKSYPIEEAIGLTKQLSQTKFDSTIEVHFRLGIDAKKGEQKIRTTVSLPHGTGKTVKVAAFVTPD